MPSNSSAQSDVDVVEGEVVEQLPEYEQAHVQTTCGRLLAITKITTGVVWDALPIGQKIRCRVTRRLPRVLSAELI